MKYSFLAAFVLGFAGLLLAAGAYPWVQHPRLASQTEVVPNGGRAERFVIRLPADRIGGHGAGAGAAGPVGRPMLGPELSIEEFKVRNAAGRVIGVAARHATATPDGRSVSWVVSIPSRGTLMLADASASADSLEAALASAGYAEGTAWEGDLAVATVTPEADAPQFSSGTAEFAGLEVGFSESWAVTGVDERGALRGTLELATISRRGS